MRCYLVSVGDVDTCNKKNIVACWSDEHNSAIVVVNVQSELIFDGHEIVEINDAEDGGAVA